MSENQREETVVIHRQQRGMSEDSPKEGRKKKKRMKVFKVYMLEFS